MKIILITLALILTSTLTLAGEYVSPYLRSDGTLVQGHYRSSADSSHNNNYSTQGNTNPYTGERGTQAPTWNDRTPEHNERTIGDPGYRDSSTNYRNIYR